MSILIPMPEKTVFMLKQDHKAFTFKIPVFYQIMAHSNWLLLKPCIHTLERKTPTQELE